MLYSIADESGARLTTEGHFSFHPNADVYYMPLEVAMMKVQLLDAKGIRATFARLEKDDSIADEYAGTYYDDFMQLHILDNGKRDESSTGWFGMTLTAATRMQIASRRALTR